MSDELMLELTGATFYSIPYILEGFDQRLVAGENYPAAYSASGSVLPGKLYKRLHEEQFRLLDAYEGQFYKRIEIICPDPFEPSGAQHSVHLYIAHEYNMGCLSSERWHGT